MFNTNNRNRAIKPNNAPNDVKKKINDVMGKEIAETLKPIEPIIFVSDGFNSNPSLFELPMEYTASFNEFVKESNICSSFVKNDVLNFDHNAIEIACNQTFNFIMQSVVASFANFINHINTKYDNLLLPFSIMEFVMEEMKKSEYKISRGIRDYIYTISSFNALDEEVNNKRKIEYSFVLAAQLSQFLFNDICYGTDKAINDIILGIHISPNYNIIINKTISILDDVSNRGVTRSINENKKNDVEAYVSIALKEFLRSRIDNFADYIFYPCSQALLSVTFTNFNVFNEYMYFNKDAMLSMAMERFLRNGKEIHFDTDDEF